MSTPLHSYRRIVLQGYLSLLEQSPPNGRLNHSRSNCIMSLRLCMTLGIDIAIVSEEQIKSLIRELYVVI